MAENITIPTTDEYVKTIFTDNVIASIVGLAAIDVKGVAAMSGGIVNNIAEKLGRKNLAKGIKVQIGEKEVAIDLFIIVDYGAKVPEVSREIHNCVKTAVETMTGLSVTKVTIYVQGVSFEKEIQEPESGEI